jgi:CMP-N,N'-diacetyllegionaminic acid synthase
MRILGLIPARGGSKGIPRKNIRLLAGKPLLQYTAEAALASKGLTRVILSTEDEEIARVGRDCGLEVPFMRPAELAQDRTPTLPVIQHALGVLLEQGESYEAICLLQPTCPLRTASLIEAAIALFIAKNADALVTILPVPHQYNPHWVYFQGVEGFLSLSTGEPSPISARQLLPAAYHREGSIYITRSDVILKQNSLYGPRLVGLPVDPVGSVNIDEIGDWEKAERTIRNFSKQP